jgi:N-acetylneuraminic acid mutarotase/fibronectin type 3 domain-containing protein
LFLQAVVVFAAPPSAADTATVMSATLPAAQQGTSAIWDGTNAYIFGGDSLNQIVRYNPGTDTATVTGATLPTARRFTSAVWDGTNAYIFGGWDDAGLLNEIVRYNPATNTVVTMSATLPSGRWGTSAVWDGTNAYIFGGTDTGATHRDQIVRYNPVTNAVTIMSVTLPSGRDRTSAIWDGTNAYVFGGWDGGWDEIVRYNPATNSVTTMSAVLPSNRWATSAVWDGTSAYIFGGYDGARLGDVVRYNPLTNSVTTMSADLPSNRSGTSAIWDGTSAYVFGGESLDEIVQYNPATPTAPRNLTAAAGPDGGEITLTWQAPVDSGAVPIINYRVYQSPASGGPYTQIAEVGNVLTYTDAGLPAPTTRYYRVAAVNARGTSPQSNEAFATTFYLAPSPPQDIEASKGPGLGEIMLHWDSPASTGGASITHYKVYRGTASGIESLVGSGGCSGLGNVQSCTDSGLADGTTYYYTVTAVNGGNLESAPSNEASATTQAGPTAPRALQAFPLSKAALALAWQAPASAGAGTIARYDVYRGVCSGCETFRASVLPEDPSMEPRTAYVDNVGLSTGTYYYRVRAVNSLGAEGAFSDEVVAAPLSDPTASGGYLQHDLLTLSNVSVRPLLPNETVGRLVIYDEDAAVCFDLHAPQPPGTGSEDGYLRVTLACLPRNLFGGADSAIPRGYVPLGTQGQALANATVSVTASYRWDEQHLQDDHASFVDGLVNVYAPVLPGDAGWFAGPGGQGAALLVQVSIYSDGALVAEEPVVVPFVGQAFAAAAATGGV